MTRPVLIKGGTIVNAHEERRADVLCEGGIITRVETNIEPKPNMQVVDATGKLVIPGGIDPHVHLSIPFMGTTSVDDHFTGTAAGLSGGTTMVIDFVIPSRGQNLVEAFKQWQGRAKDLVAADYAFHVAVTWWGDGVEDQMKELVEVHGVNSFKMFMAYKGALMLEDDGLCSAFEVCKQLGAVAQVHAENGEMVERGQKRVFEAGITGPEGHALSRPPPVEAEATQRAIAIADFVNVPLYVVHVSCTEAAEAIADARAVGKRVFGEPVAAFLGVDESHYWHEDWRHAAGYVMSPPIRGVSHQQRLIDLLSSDGMSLIGTDHCVFNGDQKAMGKDDFRKIPNGVNGVEDRLSVVWHQCVRTGKLTRQQFVEKTSTMAAKIFNIYPRKGVIQVGSDADLVVWNPDATRVISTHTDHQNVDFNIFEGMNVQGLAEFTISQGSVVWEAAGDKLSAKKGVGRYIRTEPWSPICYDGMREREVTGNPVLRKKTRKPYNPEPCDCVKRVMGGADAAAATSGGAGTGGGKKKKRGKKNTTGTASPESSAPVSASSSAASSKAAATASSDGGDWTPAPASRKSRANKNSGAAADAGTSAAGADDGAPSTSSAAKKRKRRRNKKSGTSGAENGSD